MAEPGVKPATVPKRQPVARRLTVGRADDPAETAADHFAANVLAAMLARPHDTGSTENVAASSTTKIQRRASVPATEDRLGGSEVEPGLASRIRAAGGAGQSLPTDLRQAAEDVSSKRLDDVRVHRGADVTAVSRSLEAVAFTVGSDVYMSERAGQPGSAFGNEVLAHEIGHAAGAADPTSIHRWFGGSKGAPVVGASGKAEVSNGLSKDDKAEQKAGFARGEASRKRLQKDIAPLESALKKLIKQHQKGNAASYDAATKLRDKAQGMFDLMPGPSARGAQKAMGVAYADERRRLRVVIAEAQLIVDEQSVARSKQKAGDIYMDAGRNAAKPAAPAAVAGFGKLSELAQEHAFGVAPKPKPKDAGPALWDDVSTEVAGLKQHAAGASLGLSPAETAAIMTFTAEDYMYINPATAHKASWMKSANPSLIDKENKNSVEELDLEASFKVVSKEDQLSARAKDLADRQQEGSLHAGMAIEAMKKLPVWKGKVYRGEALSQADFDGKFSTLKEFSSYKAKKPTVVREAIASASKDIAISMDFAARQSAKFDRAPHKRVLWEMDVTDGRDIEMLSVKGGEREVATFPGATFKVKSIEFRRSPSKGQENAWGTVVIKCVQTK